MSNNCINPNIHNQPTAIGANAKSANSTRPNDNHKNRKTIKAQANPM